MTNQLTNRITATLLILSVWSCQTPDPEPSPYESGVYILNAGNFSQNNGSISFLQRDSKTVTTDIFSAVNARPLIGGVQDYVEIDGKGIILVDNSKPGQDKIEIVEIGTFKSRASAGSPNIENPREVVRVGPNKAYVSCWDVSGDFSNGTFYKDPGYIAVVDMNTGAVSKKIPAVKGVEKMVATDTEVFVGSTEYSADKTLLIIDLGTDAVKQRIDFNAPPRPIALDAEGKLWLLAGSDMIRMDPQKRTIEKRLTFPAAPGSVAIGQDKKSFYYTLSGRTYQILITATTTASARVVVNRSFSALDVDPQTGMLYASPSVVLYTQAGYVLRYQPDGVLIDSVKAEIAPSRFYFR